MFRFLHLPKARKFEYKPLFYNPDKEEREERVRRIKDELGLSDEPDPNQPYQPHIKGQFRKAMGVKNKSGDEQRRKSNNRLFLLIIVLGLLCYLIFYR